MDPIALTRLILRRWWVLLIFGVVGAGTAYAVTAVAPRHYQAVVSLQLNPAARSGLLPYSNQDSSVASPVTALAASYAEVLRSRAFGEVVVNRLQLPVEPDAIARAIDAKLIPNTNILRISVTWDQPQDAQQLAQSVAEIFITENLQRQQAQTGGQFHTEDLETTASQVQTRLVALRAQRDRLDQTVSRGDMSQLTQLNDLDSRLSALETSHANLLVEINRALTSLDTAAILDRASPGQPIGTLPVPQALLLGLLVGLGIGLGVMYLLEHLLGVVRDPQEVAEIAGGPPLVAIGHIQPKKTRGSAPDSGYLVMTSDSRSAYAEAFRTLRANLRLSAIERPLRTLVVTSGSAREGKTLVSTNLAVALAQSGKRVLLVDADLRRPSLHTVFGVDGGVGLVDALLQESDLLAATESSPTQQDGYDIAGAVPSGVPNLWLLPSGRVPLNPSELLGSETATRLLARMTGIWDIVVFDTAPIGPVADALLLAEHAEGILLVVRSGQTRRTALQGAIDGLRNVAGPVMGVVLNDLKPTPLSRYGAYAYYYSSYYGKHYYGDDNNSGSHTNGTPHTNGSTQTNGRVKLAAPPTGLSATSPPVGPQTDFAARG